MIGALRDFVSDAGFDAHLDLIVDLADHLAAYREEDTAFFPCVYLIIDEEESDTLNMIAPGAQRVRLNCVENNRSAGAKILKDSAALASGGWAIFVDLSNDQINYGLFRASILPFSISSDQHMADPEEDSGGSLLMRNCSHNSVELISSNGQSLELGLTSARPGASSTSDSFIPLVEAFIRDVPDAEDLDPLCYVRRLLFSVTQECHGTIIVVLSSSQTSVPEHLADGVILDEPIDIVESYRQLSGTATAANLAELSSRELLMKGMVQSDGITILSSNGKILGFRVFVKPSDTERTELDALNIEGGARSRAFELLKLRVNEDVICAFFRSQDGRTMCEVNA